MDIIKTPTVNFEAAAAYSITYTDIVNIDKITNLDEIKPYGKALYGIVPKEFFPSEGKKFIMYYHKADDTATYGVLFVPECANVFTDGHTCYFESVLEGTAYLLKPYTGN